MRERRATGPDPPPPWRGRSPKPRRSPNPAVQPRPDRRLHPSAPQTRPPRTGGDPTRVAPAQEAPPGPSGCSTQCAGHTRKPNAGESRRTPEAAPSTANVLPDAAVPTERWPPPSAQRPPSAQTLRAGHRWRPSRPVARRSPQRRNPTLWAPTPVHEARLSGPTASRCLQGPQGPDAYGAHTGPDPSPSLSQTVGPNKEADRQAAV